MLCCQTLHAACHFQDDEAVAAWWLTEECEVDEALLLEAEKIHGGPVRQDELVGFPLSLFRAVSSPSGKPPNFYLTKPRRALGHVNAVPVAAGLKGDSLIGWRNDKDDSI